MERWWLAALLMALVGCDAPGDDDDDDSAAAAEPLAFTAVTFNTGTSESMGHDSEPDDGYTSEHAAVSDEYYGDGLAWLPAVEAATAFLADVQPDVIAFQEIFHPPECAEIPEDAHPDFICETWTEGDPTVAQLVLGEGYQVMCQPGNSDKCAAVRREFGTFAGCGDDLCLEGLAGSVIDGCGSGSRVGRGVVELVGGGELTVVAIHASSGMAGDDMDCRVDQVDQVFVDLGDGAPAASGEHNVILGDLNTDPGRMAEADPSAARWLEFVALPGEEGDFQFVTEVGEDAEPAYAGIMNIDHVISDHATGPCWHAGTTEGHDPVIDAIYLDHQPAVCALEIDL